MPHSVRSGIIRSENLGWGCFFLGCALLVLRGATWHGVFAPLEIAGGSLGERWPGEHRSFSCHACRFSFAVAAPPWPTATETICPNCRARLHAEHASAVLPGRRLLLDRAALWFRRPQRWELVAVQLPGENRWGVKRVAALPGETWQLSQGDLYINGRVVRKSPAQFRNVALLVHNDQCRREPTRSAWQSEASEWSVTPAGHAWQGRGGESDSPGEEAWLTYQHFPYHPAAKQKTVSLSDYDSYNHALARSLFTIRDVAITGRFRTSEQARLVLTLQHGSLTRVEELMSANEGEWSTFLAGSWDETLWLEVNGALVLQEEATPSDSAKHVAAQVPRFSGAGEGSVELDQLQLWRDIHYLAPDDLRDHFTPPSGDDTRGYVLLGDNQPLSIDSRHWPERIPAAQLHGIVVPW